MNGYTYETTVNYCDLGENGHLSLTGVLRIFQEAACFGAAAVGRSPQELLDRWGVGWVLMGWKVELHKRPGWGEKLIVTTWPRTAEGRSSNRDFRMVDETGELVAAATSNWLLLDIATGHVTHGTEEMLSGYPLCPERAVEGDISLGGKCPKDTPVAYTYKAMRRDLDTFHHVNNIRYLELAREALPEELSGTLFPHTEILYKRQIKWGETVHLYYAVVDGKHLVEIKGAEDNKTRALVWLY